MAATEVKITKHAKSRASKRFGIKGAGRLAHQAALAWERGASADTAENEMQRYYMEIQKRERAHIDTRIYDGVIYIFAVDEDEEERSITLLTVFGIPYSMKDHFYYQGKRVGNLKKFIRLHPEMQLMAE